MSDTVHYVTWPQKYRPKSRTNKIHIRKYAHSGETICSIQIPEKYQDLDTVEDARICKKCARTFDLGYW